jgi:hypothetical protein
MPEAIAWSINAGSPGGSIAASGSLASEAVMIAAVTIDPASSKDLAVQLGDVSKIAFLAVKSSLYNNKVRVKATGAGATEVKLLGPLVLFGGTIALLGASLATFTIANDDAVTPANIEILIGQKLT